MDIQQARTLFPIARRLTYLDNAAMSPACLPVAEAMTRFYAERATHGPDFDAWWNAAEQLKGALATLIGCRPRNLAYVSGTTEGLNVVARGLELSAGDNVLISDIEFPSNVYPWLNLQRAGVEVRWVRHKEGRLRGEDIAEAMDSRTRVVSLSHVSFYNGFRLDLETVAGLCHQRGALFVVDAMQSVGALRVDVGLSSVDALCCGTFKWLLGPDGLGFLYCSDRLLERMQPSFLGWRAVKDKANLRSYALDLEDGAARFELGNLNFSAVFGARAGLNLLAEIGSEAIERRVLGLAGYLIGKLAELDVRFLSPVNPGWQTGTGEAPGQPVPEGCSHLVSFDLEDLSGLGRRLTEAGVRVSLREGVRVSPHFYNDESDIDRLVRAVEDHVGGRSDG